MNQSMGSSVLHGIRVLDLTQMVSGPLCTLLLGDLGAEIIKVEPPEGDTSRNIGVNRPCGESDYFLSMNRNKRSIVLDLKSARGVETLKALAAQSDVLVENFRPGTMERFGLGYEQLRELNPRLVYCALSGFGPTGPYRDRPALDPVIQAMSGIMQLTGTLSSGPLKAGFLVSDFVPPLFAVIGILGALRTRDLNGKGQRVDISMLDATVFAMVPREQYYYATGKTPERLGNAHYLMAPWNTYATSDARHLMVVSHNEKYWRNLLVAIGHDSLAKDPWFATNAERMQHREALDALLAAAFAEDTLENWTRRLTQADVLFSPVRDLHEVFTDPAVCDSLVETVSHPRAGEVPMLRTPIRMETHPTTIRRAPPLLGEHTDEILAEIAANSQGA
jgi:crotonobetainyl-CoA:carnitine CoA-transferase CaiB-like acyl-CoA transferase